MKCPACVEAGNVSRFNVHTKQPAAAEVERFYDEFGWLHVHDHTTYAQVFTCTNTHAYMRSWQSPCPCRCCDWNVRPEVTEADRPLGTDAP